MRDQLNSDFIVKDLSFKLDMYILYSDFIVKDISFNLDMYILYSDFIVKDIFVIVVIVGC